MTIPPALRRAVFAAALLAALAILLAQHAAPAHADHCQPEELVVRNLDPNWNSPIPDNQDPRCQFAAHLGCPNQRDPVGCSTGAVQGVGDRVFGRGSTLYSGETLRAGAFLISDDGRYRLVMEDSGNLVLHGPSGIEWESATFLEVAARLVMQLDGNLVIYTRDDRPIWATNTFSAPARLVVQNDGNLVVYGPGGPVWSRW
jgi:hypothetical protein